MRSARAERVELGERIERSGEFDGTELLLGIQVDGRLAGEVQARQPRMGLPPGVFEIGIDLFDAADRGHGVGSAALTQLVTRLFGDEGAHRVQLTTDVENEAMRAVSTRLGFRFEGVMRSFMPSADGPRDYAIYAMTEARLRRSEGHMDLNKLTIKSQAALEGAHAPGRRRATTRRSSRSTCCSRSSPTPRASSTRCCTRSA